MKWKDSDDLNDLNIEPGENPDDGKKSSFIDVSRSLFEKAKNPAILIGAGLVVLIVLIVLLLSETKKTVDVKQTKALESMIKRLEDRIAIVEQSSNAAKGTVDQGKAVVQLNRRVDRLEETTSGKISNLAKLLSTLQEKKMIAVLPKKVLTPKPAVTAVQSSKGSYHVVKKGENLYRISLRYGLKVKELLRLNNLEPGTVINPGQKLVVGPE
ncbi:LysM peptidoglycan-binding domain-containing protein [Thermodesulfobacteriota bacterium]